VLKSLSEPVARNREVLKMRRLMILIFIILLLPGCSLVGYMLGKEVDRSAPGDSVDKHKFETQYMLEGLEIDIEITKAILSQPEQKPEFIVDTGPCKEQNAIQVCSIKRGCSCEKYVKSHYNILDVR
jgi:hypothetical protein